MPDAISGPQVEKLLGVFDEAMKVLRGDARFDPNSGKFGRLRSEGQQEGSYGIEYKFQIDSIPAALTRFITASDPLDNSDNRLAASVVPKYFNIRFDPSVSGIDRSTIEQRLDLCKFWVDSDGDQHEGNEILLRLPPNTRMHVYRYRANANDVSRFDVDVELYLVDTMEKQSENSRRKLDELIIRRVYQVITPEMRKKREEEQHKCRDQ